MDKKKGKMRFGFLERKLTQLDTTQKASPKKEESKKVTIKSPKITMKSFGSRLYESQS